MTTDDVHDCPRCHEAPVSTVTSYGFDVGCDNCYDGALDSATRGEFANAPTEAGAFAEWNSMVRDGFIGDE